MNFDPADFERFKLQPGDVLLNEGSGSAGEVGKPAIWRGEIEGCCFQNTLLRVRPRACTSEYLYYYLHFTAQKGGFVPETQGVNIHHIGREKLASFLVPLPPASEQRRIVARIEALFARISRARAELERVAPLAGRHRRQATAKVIAEAAELSPTIALGDLVSAIEAGKNIRCEERMPRSGERCIVKISAVTWGHFDAKEVKTAPADARLDPQNRIADGDFLLSRANTLELVGAPVIATGVPEATYLSDKVLRLRFREPVDEWVLWFLRSPQGRAEIEARSSGNQLSMRNIGQAALRSIPMPLPAPELRARLASTITKAQGAAAVVEGDAARALKLLSQIERAVLARAFRGELVAQDPNDEPASVSLGRAPPPKAASTRGRRARAA